MSVELFCQSFFGAATSLVLTSGRKSEIWNGLDVVGDQTVICVRNLLLFFDFPEVGIDIALFLIICES